MLKLSDEAIERIADEIASGMKIKDGWETWSPGHEKYWNEYIKRIDPHEKRYKETIGKLLQEQADEVFENIKEYPNSPLMWQFDGVKSFRKIAEAEAKFITQLYKQEGQNAIDLVLELASKSYNLKPEVSIAFDIENPLVIEELLKQTTRFPAGLINTTEEEIREAIAIGIREGETFDQIADRVEVKLSPSHIANRAEIIARTESIYAAGAGTEHGYIQSGVVEGKQWLIAWDERTCFLANTKITTKKGYIPIQNIKIGDYVLTHKDRYRKVIKLYHRKYNGKVVRITLKGSHFNPIRLTMTEDHPILVNGKWIEAKEIKQGDKINYIAKKCPVCGKLMPYFNKYCSRSCSSKMSNKILWANPKQKERLIKDNKRYNKARLMRVEFDKKINEPEFNKWYKEQCSKGQLKAYKDNPEYLKNITKSNQEKGKREDWGWKNKGRRDKALKNAYISIGKNHNGKTYLEKKVEWWLRKENIKYIPQKYINNGKRRFFVDFYLSDFNIIIEADGEYWHNEVEDRIRDKGIKEVFTGKIIHLKEDDIRNHFPECISKVENIIVNQNCFVGVEVRKVLKWKLKKNQGVYNIAVEDDNTYTANRIVVHNCDACLDMDGRTEALGDSFKIDDIIENYGLNFDYTAGNMVHPPLHCNCRCVLLPIVKKV